MTDIKYPETRFMGSKRRLLSHIEEAVSDLAPTTFVDAFAGSGVVGHRMKQLGYSVTSLDVLDLSHQWAVASIVNHSVRLSMAEAEALMNRCGATPTFIQDTFRGLYFSDDENRLLDTVVTNALKLENRAKRAIALSAVARACMKKRARGIFTYTGERYDDGRKDLSTPLSEHFLTSVQDWNGSVFRGAGTCKALAGSALDIVPKLRKPSVIYIDPPYWSTRSDNDYVRRYHFVEGMMSYWARYDIQEHTTTKKFAPIHRDFMSKDSTYQSFEKLFNMKVEHSLVISYSSNCLPSREEMVLMLKRAGWSVEVRSIPHTYSFGTQSWKVGENRNRVDEFLFIATRD